MTATDPTTAQPATPAQPEPDHIPADTDRVEAGILAEFDLSPLRDLALDLLHDLVQARAEVRRLRAELDAAPATPTTYALPAEPPPGASLWDRYGDKLVSRTAYGAQLWRTAGHEPGCGCESSWSQAITEYGPLSTVPPAGTEGDRG